LEEKRREVRKERENRKSGRWSGTQGPNCSRRNSRKIRK
jgi:hypothetical protein